jgi:hypothetical protein
MAVREFTDSTGVEWRVWDVTPQHMHPTTRAEDFMGNLRDGWLVFESSADKRRLEPPYPSNWTSLPLAGLEELCRRAAPTHKRATQSTTGKQRAIVAAEVETDAMHDAHAQVTFRSPGGREWTVRVHECLDRAGTEQLVLRFTTEDIVVELSRWPDNWKTASVEQFGLMLLDANPPRRRPKDEGPQRRSGDRVTLSDQPPRSSHEPRP